MITGKQLVIYIAMLLLPITAHSQIGDLLQITAGAATNIKSRKIYRYANTYVLFPAGTIGLVDDIANDRVQAGVVFSGTHVESLGASTAAGHVIISLNLIHKGKTRIYLGPRFGVGYVFNLRELYTSVGGQLDYTYQLSPKVGITLNNAIWSVSKLKFANFVLQSTIGVKLKL